MKIFLVFIIFLFSLQCVKSQARIGFGSAEIIEEFRTDHIVFKELREGIPTIVVFMDNFITYHFLDSINYICFASIIKPRSLEAFNELINNYDNIYDKMDKTTWISISKEGNLLIELKDFSDIGKAFCITQYGIKRKEEE